MLGALYLIRILLLEAGAKQLLAENCCRFPHNGCFLILKDSGISSQPLFENFLLRNMEEIFIFEKLRGLNIVFMAINPSGITSFFQFYCHGGVPGF